MKINGAVCEGKKYNKIKVLNSFNPMFNVSTKLGGAPKYIDLLITSKSKTFFSKGMGAPDVMSTSSFALEWILSQISTPFSLLLNCLAQTTR